MPGSTRYLAPPVSYPVGRCLWAGAFLLGMCLLLLGAFLASAGQGADLREHAPAARSAVLSMAAWMAVSAWVGWHWWHSPRGRLLWREGHWAWWDHEASDPIAVSSLDLIWDAQILMVVRLGGDGSSARWVWLERRSDLAHWDDVRRAIWAARQAGEDGP